MVKSRSSTPPGSGCATESSPLLPASEQQTIYTHPSSSTSPSPRSSRRDASTHTSTQREGDDVEIQPANPPNDHAHIVRIISMLLVGILVAHADTSIMMATHPLISSEFNDLASSGWLVASYLLAGAALQSLYGKLSDIYGRKPLILVAYTMFALGCGLVGVGQSMWQVILGRIISGAGGSGMTVLVSIVVTDLLPLRDVAQWRSYVNIVATTGRSLGGPVGGWLADAIGWRWSFLGQVPIVSLAILLSVIYLPDIVPKSKDDSGSRIAERSSTNHLRRIDFKGSILLSGTIVAFLLPLQIGGAQIPWTHPLIPSLFALGAVFLTLFIAIEKRAAEPIIPLGIFSERDAVLSFVVSGLQLSAQVIMMFLVPLYFQITARTSSAEAGAHLFPAVLGNAVGGLLSGVYIKRYGTYKLLCLVAALLCVLCYVLLLLRWHGHTGWLESLYIVPGGFGVGIAQAALFVSLQAAVDPAHLAPAVAMMYLSVTICLTTGLVGVSAVLRAATRRALRARLGRLGVDGPRREEIIEGALSDIGYVVGGKGRIGEAVVGAYVDGMWWSHGVSLILALVALAGVLLLRRRTLDRS